MDKSSVDVISPHINESDDPFLSWFYEELKILQSKVEKSHTESIGFQPVTYTSKPPSTDGYYWVKDKRDGSVYIVKVLGFYYLRCGDETYYDIFESANLLFSSGPIKPMEM